MKSLIALLVSFITSIAIAQSPEVTCYIPKYSIVYVNGVWNSPEAVTISLNALRDSITATPRNGRPVEFKFVHNKSSGAWGDLWETFDVKALAIGVEVSKLAAGYLSSDFADADELTPAQRDQIDKAYAESAAEQAALYLSNVSATIPHFRDVATQLKNPVFLNPLDSLILIGHSEGSAFSQLMYYDLRGSEPVRADSSIRLLSIGAAASEVPGLSNSDAPDGKAWVTNSLDLVIQLLRVRTSQVLPSTFTAFSLSDPSGHTLSTYLKGSTSRSAIIAKMESYFSKMTVPTLGTCSYSVDVAGTQAGWTVPAKVVHLNLTPMARSLFSIFGTPLNTCGGERGGPLWSVAAPISADASFFGTPLVSGIPYQTSTGLPNRRPCSSFVAFTLVPDPTGVELPKYRFWSNSTGRIQTFGGAERDWEYQLRYDSGNPWTGIGRQCSAGLVPNSGNYISAFTPICTARLEPV